MSVRALAKKLGVSPELVSKIELGERRFREDNKVIAKLCRVLQLETPGYEAPPDPIPPVRGQNSRYRKGYRTPLAVALGEFAATRRQELRLSQMQVAKRADTSRTTVSDIERGAYLPGALMLKKLSRALECEIPAELIPQKTDRSTPAPRTVVYLPEKSLFDLEKIKSLSGIRINSEVARKALGLLRHLLEKRSRGYIVFLRKDEEVVELESLL